MEKIHIDLEPHQRIFFTSDTHFGHKNVLEFCQRPFVDIKDMAVRMIENWNSVVRPCDFVFHQGDVCWFNSRHETRKILNQLNGTIYVTLGNHDKKEQFELCDPEKIKVLGDVTTLYVTGNEMQEKPSKPIEIFLSHEPMMTWPHRERGVPNLFGHVHWGPNCQNKTDNDLPLWPLQYDTGTDNNNYTPIELTEVLKKIQYERYRS